jgi:hypothetical protein
MELALVAYFQVVVLSAAKHLLYQFERLSFQPSKATSFHSI